LADSRFARALSDVYPTPRQGPRSVLADEQKLLVAEDDAANTELRRRVARLERETRVDGRDVPIGREHLGGDLPHLLVPLAVVDAGPVVGHAGLRDRLQPSRPVEQLRDGLRHHCAPAGAERRTIVISSHSGTSSSVCVPRSIASPSGSPTRVTSSPRSSAGRTPSACGHSSSTALRKRGSSRKRSCHISACMRWYASSRSILAASP